MLQERHGRQFAERLRASAAGPRPLPKHGAWSWGALPIDAWRKDGFNLGVASIVVLVLTMWISVALVAGWRRMMLRVDAGIPQAALAAAWRRLCPPRQRAWHDVERRALARMRSLVVVAVSGRVAVPSTYDVFVSSEDLARMGAARAFVETDLAAAILSEARQQGWHVLDVGVQVRIHREEGVVAVPRVVASFGAARGTAKPPVFSRSARVQTMPLVTEVETRPSMTEGDGSGEAVTQRSCWRLVPLDDADPGLELPDRIGVVTVGRTPGSDLRLAYPTVSGLHARLRRVTSGWQVEDAGSRNGTFLNDREVDHPAQLADGMVIAFSRSGPRYTLSAPGRQTAATEGQSRW